MSELRAADSCWYDYANQAWVVNGVYQACGHPKVDSKNCAYGCFGNLHNGDAPSAAIVEKYGRHVFSALPSATKLEGWFLGGIEYDVPEDIFELTWGEFCQINADSDELQAIETALFNNEEFRGGGGAAVPYLVRLLKR